MESSKLHHAYLLLGDREAARSLIDDTFGELGITLTNSPDHLVVETESFGIDDARKLSDWAVKKAFHLGGRKVAFISPDRITDEAQNALLKTFEEPISGTHFFLNLRDGSNILPTLLSRVSVLSVQGRVLSKEAEDFLEMSLKERLAFAKKFAEAEKDLPTFLNNLLLVTRHKSVYEMCLISKQRGSSPRLVLEHLALVL